MSIGAISIPFKDLSWRDTYCHFGTPISLLVHPQKKEAASSSLKHFFSSEVSLAENLMSFLDRHIDYEPTQREPLDGSQVQNRAGGYVYEISIFDTVKRFLTIGTEGGTYYQDEHDLTKQNFDNLNRAIDEDAIRVVEMVRDISIGGKAIKPDMALFTLAVIMSRGDDKAKAAVGTIYDSVIRTGSHQLMFASFADRLCGWGRSLSRMVGNWYMNKDADELAYQVTKYRNRNDWTHRDVLRRCHYGRNTALFRWIARPTLTRVASANMGAREIPGQEMEHWRNRHNLHYEEVDPNLPRRVQGLQAADSLAKTESATARDMIDVINEYNLTHEMVPNQFYQYKEVWEALLPNMPLTALLRNLGQMTSLGLFPQFSDNAQLVLDNINRESVKKARLHPIQILGTMLTYKSGKSVLGSLSWRPNGWIVAHLEDAFYWTFDNIEPCNKNLLLALDCSGSMFNNFGRTGPIKAYPMLNEGQIAAVLAMVTARTEPNHHICAFSSRFVDFPISRQDSLREVINKMENLPHGGTDCALPMIHAAAENWDNIEGFVVYTDNETWAGDIHPKRALEKYREKTGQDARLAVSAMTGTAHSIADGSVPWMMDFVGMSPDTPAIISRYLAGEF